ncbi:hypothetical protein V513_12090 [Mesotoga sp. H07.pep.5.3]|nr:hypothetical protein V513_12090 [Mesotoga sp. H07.pep.5.3]
MTSLLERRRQESIIETTVMESSEKVIPNVKMDLGFLRLKIRTSCFSFSQAPGTSVKRRESREMKKGISYMFVSPKGSEKKNKMVCASKTVSAVIVAHMQSPVLDRNIGLLHELLQSKRSIYVRTLFYDNHEEINENPSFQYSINRNLKIGS